jgi:imidazolonepropionase
VAVKAGHIAAVGPTREIHRAWKARQIINASGCAVTPGLVDPHTHAVFAGDRAQEFEWRWSGRTYQAIAAEGGGILSTVRATRAASTAALAQGLSSRLDRMLLAGTTTAEVKSGYGLSLKEELRHLEIVARVARRHPVRLVPTFLGAHALPPEYKGRWRAYADLVCARMIPAVGRRKLARFCDVFVDEGAFSLREGVRILAAARKAGLGLKVHAEEFARTGAAAKAASMGAISVDHLMKANRRDIRKLAASRTVAVCLPVTTLFVGEPAYAPARRMLEAGCAVAVATDLNPGSSHAYSMALAMSLACLGLRLTPAEALVAATLNAAYAIGEGDQAGSLEVGKRADLVVWEAPDHRHIPYTLGANLVRDVVAGGKVVVEGGQRRSG